VKKGIPLILVRGCLSSGDQERIGILTAIGAVSPPGGDLSDPVAQSTLRIVQVFWSLDSNLAYRRHFPAINWLTSYSLYQAKVDAWLNDNITPDFSGLRLDAMTLLQEESELEEIVRLIGQDALSDSDRLKLESARSLREDFLHQNSFDEVDTYTSMNKQIKMLSLVMHFYYEAQKALAHGVDFDRILGLPIREEIARFRYVPEHETDRWYVQRSEQLVQELSELSD